MAAQAKVIYLEKGLTLRGRTRIALAVLVSVGVALTIVFGLVNHDFSTSWFPVVEVLVATVLIRVAWRGQLRRARQAMELNSGESPASKQPR